MGIEITQEHKALWGNSMPQLQSVHRLHDIIKNGNILATGKTCLNRRSIHRDRNTVTQTRDLEGHRNKGGRANTSQEGHVRTQEHSNTLATNSSIYCILQSLRAVVTGNHLAHMEPNSNCPMHGPTLQHRHHLQVHTRACLHNSQVKDRVLL